MKILFSGLDTSVLEGWWPAVENTTGHVSIVPPAVFFDLFNSSNIDENTTRLVWLYRSPWETISQADDTHISVALKNWQSLQNTFLERIRTHSTSVIAINIDSTSSASLQGIYSVPGSPKTLDKNRLSTRLDILPELFEAFAPHYWDTFESLESVSWPQGGASLFRNNIDSLKEDDFFKLLRTLESAKKVNKLELDLNQSYLKSVELEKKVTHYKDLSEKLDNLQIKNSDLEKTLVYEKARTFKAESSLSELKRFSTSRVQQLEHQNRLLIAQLKMTQDELLEQYDTVGKYDAIFEVSRETLHRANLALQAGLHDA